MNILTKAGIATLGVGAIGGAGAYSGGLFESKTDVEKPILKTKYRERLTEEGFDTNVTDWKTILVEYNKVEDTQKTFKVTATEEALAPNLIEKCRALLNRDDNNENDYKKAKRWCVKEETADAILKKFKVKVLNTESTDADKSDWQNKIEKLKPINETSTKLGVKDNVDEATNITAIKTQCKTLVATKTTDEKFEENFKLAKDWCSVPTN